jgi:hypothetical protein
MTTFRFLFLRAACAVALIACSDHAPRHTGATRADADSAVSDASTPPRVEPDSGAQETKPEPATDAGRQVAVDAGVTADSGAPDPVTPTVPDDDAGASDEPGHAQVDPELAALIDWVITTLNEGRAPTSAAITQRFSAEFLLQLAPADLATTLVQLSNELRPVSVAQRTVQGLQAVIRLDSADGPWNLEMVVSAATPRKISQLVFRPAAVHAETYAEVIRALQPLAASTQLLVAHVSADGRCSPIVEHEPNERLAIGSAFKLWVLLALSQKLEDDPTVSWTTKLPIRDALKSLPSGVLQNEPAGTQLSLDEYARKMIEISDNTAADHLIDYLGRPAVEAAQTTTRHSNPAANIPWLMTRDMFVLKLALSASELDAYRTASVPEKRALLDGYRDIPLDAARAAEWTEPRALDLEWFATPLDLCNALGSLGARADFTPSSQLLEILGLNPGMMLDASQWSYIGYKGGSEPGVLNMSWLLQRADGAWFSVILTLNVSTNVVDTVAALQVALALMPIVAAESGG